jgi:hypothetical protein
MLKKALLCCVLFFVALPAHAEGCDGYPFAPGEICYQQTDGGMKLLGTGVAEVFADDTDEVGDATMEATLEAKAGIAKFLNRWGASKETIESWDDVIRKERNDWQCLSEVAPAKKSVQLEALLVGAVKLSECYDKGQQVLVSVTITPGTVAAALDSLNRIEEASTAQSAGDYAAAERLLQPVAEQGVADAQFQLGSMYENGQGVNQDDDQATHWYKEAAGQGLADAQYCLWRMYYRRDGHVDEGVDWLRQAAEQGYTDAQYRLAKSYHTGTGGLAMDQYEAFDWYGKSAEQGHTKSHYNLGRMIEQGHGVQKDLVRAYAHYDVALRLKYSKARQRLEDLQASLSPGQINQGESIAMGILKELSAASGTD